MNPQVSIRKDQLAAFCKRWQVTELALFGSVLRDDFGPDSDVGVLVQFEEEARIRCLTWSAWRKSCRRYSDVKSIF